MIGDIWAEVSLTDGPTGLSSTWGVIRYTNANGTTWTPLGGGNFVTPITPGAAYTLYIAYDQVANQFTFRIGAEETKFGPTGLPARVRTPNRPAKGLQTRVQNDNSTSSCYLAATFDTVLKNGSLYDDFSSSEIDATKWASYEIVREISEGELRSEVRSGPASTSSISSSLPFVDPSSINVVQAKVTPVAYENENGASILARIGGIYFNDGTPGGGYLGDVWAEVTIGGINGEANPVAGWAVVRYTDSAGSHVTLVEKGNFSKPISLGETYTLLIGWTGSYFIFKIEDEVAYYTPATKIKPPKIPWKELGTRVRDAAGKEAMIEALFDDVMVEQSAPDLTGEWTSLTQVCKPSKKDNQCSITGTFIPSG